MSLLGWGTSLGRVAPVKTRQSGPLETRDERRLLNLQRNLSRLGLLIIDELSFVLLSPTGAELLFDEWTTVFGSERLIGALLDRLTHHVHILEMTGDSYRLPGRGERIGRPGNRPESTNRLPTQLSG